MVLLSELGLPGGTIACNLSNLFPTGPVESRVKCSGCFSRWRYYLDSSDVNPILENTPCMSLVRSSSLAGPRREAVPSVSASPKRTEISITKPPQDFLGVEEGGGHSGVMFLGPDLEIILRVQRARKRESVYIPACLHRSGMVAEGRTSPQRRRKKRKRGVDICRHTNARPVCMCVLETVVQSSHTWKLGIPPHDV